MAGEHTHSILPPERAEDEETLFRALVVETEGRVWAVHPHLLHSLSELHGHRISGRTFAEVQEMMAAGARVNVSGAGVATIPLKGVLTPQVSLLQLLFGGGSSLLQFQQSLRQAAADPDVTAIVLDVDSPGGMVDMIPEIGQDVAAAAKAKPTVAVANTMAASAAYWLASQANQVVVTPSGEVGSIGVYQMHQDLSKAYEMEGIKPTLISAGRYKVEGNPYEPLGVEAATQIQQEVNDFYDMFTSAVASGRGVSQEDVQNGYGEGRSLLAKRAVSAGLADRVDTLENTVKRLGTTQARKAITNKSSEEDLGDAQVVVEMTREDRYRLLDTLAG